MRCDILNNLQSFCLKQYIFIIDFAWIKVKLQLSLLLTKYRAMKPYPLLN